MNWSDVEEHMRRQQAEIERIDAGGSALEGSEELPLEEYARFKKPMVKMLMVRLSDEQWRLFYDEAKRRGTTPTTLLRMLALEKIQEQRAAEPRPIAEPLRN